MGWTLFLDDERDARTVYEKLAPDTYIARSSRDALALIETHRLPSLMLLDHDLGEGDTTVLFLRALLERFDPASTSPPAYCVHSANPVGAENIRAIMTSWSTVYQEMRAK